MNTMTAPTDLPDGRFEQLWLPLWPLASDNLREGICRTSRHKALGKRYVEANPDAISNLLVVDIDHEDALLRAMWNRAQWRPNTVVENPANSHAHAVWALEVPRFLFLGICLVFYYVVTWVMFPKFGFYFSRRMVAEALVQTWFVSPIRPSNVAISTSTTSFQVRV